MENKGHDAGRQDIVLHESIPGGPEALEYVELNELRRDLIIFCPVGVGRRIIGGVACIKIGQRWSCSEGLKSQVDGLRWRMEGSHALKTPTFRKWEIRKAIRRDVG